MRPPEPQRAPAVADGPGERSGERARREPPEFDPRRYWDRRLGRSWSLQGVGLSRLSRPYNVWVYRARRLVFKRTVRSLPLEVRRAKVLDIGSGTGFYVNLWRRLGARSVTGVDIADSAVKKLRKRFPDLRFERLDIAVDDISALDGGYDVVSAFDMLFHIVDDEAYARAIANVHHLLRPGGWFVFSEHFLRGQKVESRHFVTRSLEQIEGTVKAAGFEVVSRRPMLVLMNWPIESDREWLRSLHNRLVPGARSERWGGLTGAALYPFEVTLARLLRASPSTEIMVCRKPA